MSDFEKWLEKNYPVVGLDICEKEGDRYTHKPTRNMHDAYLAGQQSKEAAIQEMDEVIKMQDADLRKYEKQIESLREQLNNMETCYIEKKKELDELQKTNISLEAGLRKNSKNKQKLLGKNIELQKRIDGAVAMLTGVCGKVFIGDVVDTLRGAND